MPSNARPTPPATTPALNWEALFGLIVGMLFIAGGVWVNNLTARERATLVEIQGTVVDTVSRTESSGDKNTKVTYAPVIEYLANGDRARFTGTYQSSRLSYGTAVVVRYDPNQPTGSARQVDPFEDLTAVGMFGMGGFSILAGLSALLKLRERWARLRGKA